MRRVQAITVIALDIPALWAVVCIAGAVLASIHINVDSHGDVSGSFAPSGISAVLVALVWLPSLLRVIALAGGGVKTPAGEATTGGLLALLDVLEPGTKRDTLPTLIAALTSPEVVVDPDRRDAVRPIQRDLEMQLAAASGPAMGVREQLEARAREYEEIRENMEPSRERTLRMTTAMAEARAAARAAPLPLIDLRTMLSSNHDGERVIALALVQDQPDTRLLDLILPAISESRSAFEQYQALGAMFELVPMFGRDQREAAIRTLSAALADSARDIRSDASRHRMVEALLNALRHP